jgi:uncharacterized protein
MAEEGEMSAASLNANDRELDALRRAQRAHEPCMEEILASIRNIIADDKELLSRADPVGPVPQRPAAGVSGPQIVYSKDAPAPQREDAPAPEPATPKVVWSQPEPLNAAAAFETPREEQCVEEPLLSPATEEAVASAFQALSANLAARRAELADGMIRELLRPMLKAWLDENLAGIVEPLVRAEIERVARGPR